MLNIVPTFSQLATGDQPLATHNLQPVTDN